MNDDLMDNNWKSRITMEPGKRSGQPCIRGMRITVLDVLEHLAGGMTADEILADFPELTAEDLQAWSQYLGPWRNDGSATH
ncbi:MAG TPA: DUF433 domain-containing protein [Pirellulales bacterium]